MSTRPISVARDDGVSRTARPRAATAIVAPPVWDLAAAASVVGVEDSAVVVGPAAAGEAAGAAEGAADSRTDLQNKNRRSNV